MTAGHCSQGSAVGATRGKEALNGAMLPTVVVRITIVRTRESLYMVYDVHRSL